MSIKNKLAIIAALLIAPAAFAQDFDRIASEITRNAPALKADLARQQSALLSLSAENNLANPEVSLESLFGVYGDNKYNVELSQAFDWPGLYSARKSMYGAAYTQAIAEQKLAERQTWLEVSSLMADIIVSSRKIVEYKRISDGFASLLSHYENEYAKGNVSVLDVNKLRIENAVNLSNLEAEIDNLADLKCRLTTISNNAGLTENAAALNELPLISLDPVDTYLNAAKSNSAEILAAEAACISGEKEVEVAKKSNFPGFSLGYRFSHEDAQVFNGFTFSMSIPAWGNRHKVAAARDKSLAASIELDAARARITSLITAEYTKAENLNRRISRYSGALLASDNVGLLRKAFDAGQITLTQYIQDIQYFIETHVTLLDLRLEYTKSLLTLKSMTM